MQRGTRVEYQTGIAEFGIGDVVAFDPATEIVKVVDVDDGSPWTGPADLATPVAKDEYPTDSRLNSTTSKE